MTPREALIAAASALVGATYPADAYLDAVAPTDTAARRLEIGRESGCALVLLGIQEAAFDVPPRLPYRDGSAFALVWDRARGMPWRPGGAVRLCTLDSPPEPGDAVSYAASPGAVGHVDACVTSADLDGDVCRISAVAGGQRAANGAETVALVNRTLRWAGHAWRDVDNGREVQAAVMLGDMYPVREAA